MSQNHLKSTLPPIKIGRDHRDILDIRCQDHFFRTQRLPKTFPSVWEVLKNSFTKKLPHFLKTVVGSNIIARSAIYVGMRLKSIVCLSVCCQVFFQSFATGLRRVLHPFAYRCFDAKVMFWQFWTQNEPVLNRVTGKQLRIGGPENGLNLPKTDQI